MKVLMVDPWGTYNMYLYTSGLCESVGKHVDLTLWTNAYFPQTKAENYLLKRMFFKRSEKMKPGFIRKITRICEYYCAYFALLKDLKKEHYDLIHVQWLLHYQSDIIFLSIIKKLGLKIIYTAHNILPHRSGKRDSAILYKIYGKVDQVLVHGAKIEQEFIELYAGFKSKVTIQHHGSFAGQDLSYNIELIGSEITARLKTPEKIFIFFGHLFYNKGVDRLAKIWLKNFKDQKQYLLIIAGKKDETYKELAAMEADLFSCSNLLYIDQFIESNLLHYLVEKSDLVLLPYRHASMSGVLFTAAAFKKPVLSTKTGSIEEYLVDKENSFLTANNDVDFAEKLISLAANVNRDILAKMGMQLNEHIERNYSWAVIGEKLAAEVYRA